MPHIVTIEKSTQEDDWGVTGTDQELVTVNARVIKNTKREVISLASGDDIVFSARILLEGMPDVDYPDHILYTDARGNSFRKEPLEIDYKYDLSGNPVGVGVVV